MPTSVVSATLAELSQLISGELRGDGTTALRGIATLDAAQAGEITLADHRDRASALEVSPATAAVVPLDFPPSAKPTIAVADVHTAFATLVRHFRPPRTRTRHGISPQAWVSPTARLAADVEVHPGATIDDDVVIGPRCTIHAGVRILAGCVIGCDTTIFPNAVLYEDTRVGDRVLIHAGAVLGAYGFGYREVDGTHQLSAQLGNVVIASDVEIGACATVDRGTYGSTSIGEGTKIDNLVQIGHNCRLGKHNLICGQVGIAGSTTTGDHVVMAGQVGVRDHVHIGSRAVLCSKAGVPNNVPEGEIVLGQPATPLRRQKLQMAAIAKLPEMRHDFRKLQQQVEQMQQQLLEVLSPSSDERAA
jgi:UDP-3-O-[3-hydroxymyristoyl] glucosamine N-acyltransferase